MCRSAQAYYQATSYSRQRMPAHFLDWNHPPEQFKVYPDRTTRPLPRPDRKLPVALWQAARRSPAHSEAGLDLVRLARLLIAGHRLTARRSHGGQDFYFRSAASAGALNPNEVYLAVHAVDGLAPGLYHYDIRRAALVELRRGTPPADVGTAGGPGRPAARLFVTGIVFRSAWKYAARALRYVLLDGGHVVQNFVLAAQALEVAWHADYDFDGRHAEEWLGLDPEREICLAAIDVGRAGTDAVTDTDAPVALPGDGELAGFSRVSPRERTYPEIEAMIDACRDPRKARRPPAISMVEAVCGPTEAWEAIGRAGTAPPDTTLADAVARRRSQRNFVDRPLSRDTLVHLCDLIRTVLEHPARYGDSLVCGLAAGRVTDVEPGVYLLDANCRRWHPTAPGDMLAPLATACLDQAWLAKAAVHVFMATDWGMLDAERGPRGYRHAQITAGRIGQALYLGASAMGLGCCGIGAYYDDEVRQVLALPEGAAMIYLLGVGPVKRVSA